MTLSMKTKKHEQTNGERIANDILKVYQPTNYEDIRNAFKDLTRPMLEAMLQGEMDAHLGYDNNSKCDKSTTNRRNGYSTKNVIFDDGKLEIKVPRDREASFDPILVPKRSKVLNGLNEKVIAMYAKGMSEREIAEMVEDIYGLEVSAETVSNIVSHVMEEALEWQNRPLKAFYPFIFVDCMYVSIRSDRGARQCAAYVALGYDVDGNKDILGIWIAETEGKHQWMQIFDELKARGVEDVGFISMDGLTGLEEGAKAVFPNAITQRCIVHILRNSMKYVPSKEYKAFTSDIKRVYTAVNLSTAHAEFERFQETWMDRYPGAVNVWIRNWKHVEQLYSYGSAVRKVMYTTNAIESVNSSLRKITKKGTFPSEASAFRALYLRAQELIKKWGSKRVPNWSLVRNQLCVDPQFEERMLKYERS